MLAFHLPTTVDKEPKEILNQNFVSCKFHKLPPNFSEYIKIIPKSTPTSPAGVFLFLQISQCLKCLTPVKTIVKPYLLAMSMESWSRTDPPG